MIFNLCEERVYSGQSFGGDTHPDCVRHYPFPDHNPPCLGMIHAICLDAANWLNGDANRVVAVHCKAGKGRTGLVVSSLLVHLGICPSADEALAYFSAARTNDGKGVTIPSQIRYVRYESVDPAVAYCIQYRVRDPAVSQLKCVQRCTEVYRVYIAHQSAARPRC